MNDGEKKAIKIPEKAIPLLFEDIETQAQKIIETCRKLKDLDEKNAQIRSESENLLVDVMDDFQEAMEEITEPGALPGSSS